MKKILDKIKASFKRSTKGEETFSHVVWWWGVIGYLITVFIAKKLILAIDVRFIDVFISLIVVIYFSWHIYAVKKCAPKKEKLTDEEKKKLKEDRGSRIGKKVVRKLLAQEAMTKWNPVLMVIAIDVLCITHFARYFFK